MNVLIVADDDTKYGASKALIQMVIGLKCISDINITVVLNHESEFANVLRYAGCEVCTVHYAPYYHEYPAHLWWTPVRFIHQAIRYYYGRFFSIRELKKKVEMSKIDLIHSNSSRDDFGATLSKKYNIPLVWHIREFGNNCFHLRKDYIELMNRNATVLIAVSNAVKKHWLTQGIKRQKIVSIYDGVQTTEVHNVKHNSLTKKPIIRLVMTGFLCPFKGQEYAIRMMNLLMDEDIEFNLDLIGEGTWWYKRKLVSLIKTFGLEKKVRLLGYRKDVYNLLPNYDIGLNCSQEEGFGLVTAEYMMAGLAVLASNTGANCELIREGIDGYLYIYNNIEDMKLKLLRIINNNLGGEATHQYAYQHYSNYINADTIYNSVYKSILN